MAGSKIAAEIDKEYRIKQFYKNRKSKQQKCRDRSCNECQFKEICTTYNVDT